MLFRVSLLGLLTFTFKVTRTEGGAFCLVHIWILKFGMHFGFSAQD